MLIMPWIGYAQKGPGGVGNTDGNSHLVLWLSASSINTTDGSRVNVWNDLSGYKHHFNEGKGARFNATGSNGYSTLSFNGAWEYFQRKFEAKLSTEEFSVITATQDMHKEGYRAVVSNRHDLLGDSTAGFILYATKYDKTWQFWTGSENGPWNWNRISSTSPTSQTMSSQAITYDGNSVKRLYVNQALNASNNHTITQNKVMPYRIGAGRNESTGPNYFFKGEMGEIIQFDVALNSTQLILINNYLSAKYGFALAKNDLYVQDQSATGNFDHDVAGIGRLTNTDKHEDSQGTGIVRFLNPSNLNDNEFFLWGHNGLSQNAIETSDVPLGVEARFERVWRVSEVDTNLNSVNVGTLDMRFDLNGLGNVVASDLRLMLDQNNDGLFAGENAISGAVDLGNGIFEFKSVAGFTNGIRFTLGTINPRQTPLPVELLSFTAKPVDNSVELNWETASEINNDYFLIERSEFGTSWETIARVNGQGNSVQLTKYSELDYSPFTNKSFYRLKQVDFDGAYTYSNVVLVDFDNSKQNVLLYPNPTSGRVTISADNLNYQNVSLFNAQGQQIQLSGISNQVSSNELSINLEALNNGIYFIKYENQSYKIQKQ